MKNVRLEFKELCKNNGIYFSSFESIMPYNDSTLFCPAGMQQYSELFSKSWIHGTSANIQSCLRVNDIETIGDGSHLLFFNMLGLFSFREMTMKMAMDFWVSFLEEYLELKIDKITVHPKKLREWLPFIDDYLTVETDNECTWTDGVTFGYCMEFYVGGVEVGNIVNTGGDCIDAGFGLERLETACNGTKFDKGEILKESIEKIIEAGYEPSNTKQGYVLRKLLNLAVKNKLDIKHHFYEEEKERIKKMQEFYEKNKTKYPNKDNNWWKETHGVDIEELQGKLT